jgi:hypothetical protein
MSCAAGPGIAMLLALSNACFAFDGESNLRERLRTEAPQAWDTLAENLLHSEGDGTRTETVTDSGKVAESKTTRIAFRLAGPAVRIEATGAETGNQAVFCMNSRYGFQLNRDAESQPFVIRSTRPRTREDASTAKFGIAGFGFEEFDVGLLQFLGAPWIVDGRPLSSMICRTDSKIQSITPVEYEGRDCVDVRFSYFPSDENENEFTDATVILDPAKKWSVQKYECTTSWGKVSGEVKYDAADGDWPVPQHVTQRMEGTTEKSTYVNAVTFEFNTIQRRNVPDSEFTLSAFDLPELTFPGDQPAPSRRRQWLILGNVILGSVFALVLLMRYVRQRRSAGTPPFQQ